MAKKVSMEFIANILGVSKNTVSLAFREMPGISDSTRELILKTAQEYGYTYKKETIGDEIEQISKSICLIIPKSIKNLVEFFGHIQYGIEDEAKKNRLNTMISYYDENSKSFEIPACISEGMISGIITLGRISTYTLGEILNLKLPVVMVDHYIENVAVNSILTDNFYGGYIATEYLIAKGHKKIGFIGDINLSVSYYDRYQGFCKAMRNNNIGIEPSLGITNMSMEYIANENIELVVNEISRVADKVEAFFCCNDTEAIATCKALRILGKKLPEDISVIGFDNVNSAKNIYPELTTVHVEKNLMGKKAVMKLLELMESSLPTSEKLLITPTLVERQSVFRKM